MAEPKTHVVPGVTEIDFNSEPLQKNFEQVYVDLLARGCPFAHSSEGDF
ncbi:MAG TPA: hypothetical protein VKQ54_09670 [Caulobacteraceae bacterium]|nr:hypothetical protein [Caulobacteraceae bacterium]